MPITASYDLELDEDEDGLDYAAINQTRMQLGEEHKLLKLRLAPLRHVQRDLERRLGSGAEEPTSVPSGFHTSAAPFGDLNVSRHQEFFVRSSTGWKSALASLRSRNSTGSRDDIDNRNLRERESEETSTVISGCKDDMKTLWDNRIVRTLLELRRIRLEDGPGFYLDEIDRVASRDYTPSDDDIVRARLRTMGVQEYRFFFEKG